MLVRSTHHLSLLSKVNSPIRVFFFFLGKAGQTFHKNVINIAIIISVFKVIFYSCHFLICLFIKLLSCNSTDIIDLSLIYYLSLTDAKDPYNNKLNHQNKVICNFFRKSYFLLNQSGNKSFILKLCLSLSSCEKNL